MGPPPVKGLPEYLASGFMDCGREGPERGDILWREWRRLPRSAAVMRSERDDNEAASTVADALGAIGDEVV